MSTGIATSRIFAQVGSWNARTLSPRWLLRIGFLPFVGIVVARYVAGKLRAHQLEPILFDDMLLDHVATGLIDRMRDIGVELIGRVVIGAAIVAYARTAVVAIVAADVILISAATAAIGELAARHGYKRTMAAFDNFQVTDHKTVVEGDGTEGSQAILRFLH